MKTAELMRPDGRVFLKSEWGPISDRWPCVSFTRRSVGDRLRADFRPGRDVLLYVGTTDPENTKDPHHRSRLLSAVVIQPDQVLETKKIVPATSLVGFENRWPHAMAVITATNFTSSPLPDAREVVPVAYRALSHMENRGGVVEVVGEERAKVIELEVDEITLKLSDDVSRYLQVKKSLDIDKLVNQAITRMIGLIQQRVQRGDSLTARKNPLRHAPDTGELLAVLVGEWQAGGGTCRLCGGKLAVGLGNPMLQPSADRIDSDDGGYHRENVQLTHLGCNLAKSSCNAAQFIEWLDVVRGDTEGSVGGAE
jgi:hypothetical protein